MINSLLLFMHIDIKNILTAIACFILGGLIVFVFLPQEPCIQYDPGSNISPKNIGGDRDEYGCLVAAGYSWCEEKQKCLREWEEPCEAIGNKGEDCAVMGCHGLDIVCGEAKDAPSQCDAMYQLGDNCRAYAECEKVGGECQQKPNGKFDACKACVQLCEKKYSDDPQKAFACEVECR